MRSKTLALLCKYFLTTLRRVEKGATGKNAKYFKPKDSWCASVMRNKPDRAPSYVYVKSNGQGIETCWSSKMGFRFEKFTKLVSGTRQQCDDREKATMREQAVPS